MEKALLQNLMAGAQSSSQFIGGLVVALLYVVIGLLSAIGSILVFRRMFQGRWEQIFMHGVWDLSHSLSGTSLVGLSITEIPLGYDIFAQRTILSSRVIS